MATESEVPAAGGASSAGTAWSAVARSAGPARSVARAWRPHLRNFTPRASRLALRLKLASAPGAGGEAQYRPACFPPSGPTPNVDIPPVQRECVWGFPFDPRFQVAPGATEPSAAGKTVPNKTRGPRPSAGGGPGRLQAEQPGSGFWARGTGPAGRLSERTGKTGPPSRARPGAWRLRGGGLSRGRRPAGEASPGREWVRTGSIPVFPNYEPGTPRRGRPWRTDPSVPPAWAQSAPGPPAWVAGLGL